MLIVDQPAVTAIRQAVMTAVAMHEASYKPAGIDPFLEPGKYEMTMEECAVEACKLCGIHHLLAPLIWLALAETSNDAQAWAEGEYDSSFSPDGNLIEGPTMSELNESLEPDALQVRMRECYEP